MRIAGCEREMRLTPNTIDAKTRVTGIEAQVSGFYGERAPLGPAWFPLRLRKKERKGSVFMSSRPLLQHQPFTFLPENMFWQRQLL